MSYMFYYCSSLTSLDLSGWDTGNVTNMSSMFYGCKSLNKISFGSNWNIKLGKESFPSSYSDWIKTKDADGNLLTDTSTTYNLSNSVVDSSVSPAVAYADKDKKVPLAGT